MIDLKIGLKLVKSTSFLTHWKSVSPNLSQFSVQSFIGVVEYLVPSRLLETFQQFKVNSSISTVTFDTIQTIFNNIKAIYHTLWISETNFKSIFQSTLHKLGSRIFDAVMRSYKNGQFFRSSLKRYPKFA